MQWVVFVQIHIFSTNSHKLWIIYSFCIILKFVQSVTNETFSLQIKWEKKKNLKWKLEKTRQTLNGKF